jgi:hypothetical protein
MPDEYDDGFLVAGMVGWSPFDPSHDVAFV